MKKLVSLLLLLTLLSCSMGKEKFVGNWVEVIPYDSQVVQGFSLNADGTVKSINLPLQNYEHWKIDGDNLIVSGKNKNGGAFADTLAVIDLTSDSIMLERCGEDRVGYFKIYKIETPKVIAVLDSLKGDDRRLGRLLTRTYRGILPAASSPGIEYTVTIYNHQYSGDGVYQATLKYLEADNGKDQIYDYKGRLRTLRGDAVDKDATVYQLIPFSTADTMNFLYKDNKIELLNRDFERAQSGIDYSLKLME